MDTAPMNREWYGGFDERLMELGKEDPEVYKHWHDWYEPKASSHCGSSPNLLKVLRSSWKC